MIHRFLHGTNMNLVKFLVGRISVASKHQIGNDLSISRLDNQRVNPFKSSHISNMNRYMRLRKFGFKAFSGNNRDFRSRDIYFHTE
ncbi:hypothetical protein D3C81_1186590 [compost metagenome]